MRKKKTALRPMALGVLLFALGVIVGARMMAPEQMASKLETPVITEVNTADALLVMASEQVTITPAPTPEPAAPRDWLPIEVLYSLTTDSEEKIPSGEMPARVARYFGIEMSSYELWELACVTFLESGNQSAEGQQAVVEVIFNRVISPDFPDTVHGVIHDDGGIGVVQFSTAAHIDTAEPTQEQYDAIYAALFEESILPTDVVYFSRSGENDRVWGKIGDHVFCHGYVWG